MHARLLLSQEIFSLEKKPTTWGLRGITSAISTVESGSGEAGVYTNRK